MADTGQGRRRREGITRLPPEPLRAVLQEVVDRYRIFPPALVCREWHETMQSLRTSVDVVENFTPEFCTLEPEEFRDSMLALGTVESLKVGFQRVRGGLAAVLALPGGTRWCAHLKFLKTDVDELLAASPLAAPAFASLTAASLWSEGTDDPVWLHQLAQLKRLSLHEFDAGRDLALPLSLEELRFDITCSRKLPNSIGRLLHLRVLKLISLCTVTHLPASMGNLVMLQELDVRSCDRLLSVPRTLRNLSNLQRLTMQDCIQLKRPLEFLRGSHQLQSLEVCRVLSPNPDTYLPFKDFHFYWPDSSFPRGLGRCTALQVLSLSSDIVRTLAFPLGGFTKLRKLRLYSPMLSELPSSVSQLLALEELLIFSDQLTSLPSDLTNPNLKLLGLYCPSLQRLPYAWGPSLRQLLVGGRQPQSPEEEPKGCQLAALPVRISSLVNLEVLAVASSKLRTLPGQAAPQLKRLRDVRLWRWCGSGAHLGAFFCSLPSLESLRLVQPYLDSFPRLARPLPHLQQLHVNEYKGSDVRDPWTVVQWASQITDPWGLAPGGAGARELQPAEHPAALHPDSLLGATALRKLDLDLSYLLGLPRLATLRSLVTLAIGNAETLTSLHDSMTRLVMMEELSLSGLGISRLPASVSRLLELRVLKIYRCPNFQGLGLRDSAWRSWPRLKELQILRCRAGPSAAPVQFSNEPVLGEELPSLEDLYIDCPLVPLSLSEPFPFWKLSSLTLSCGRSSGDEHVTHLPSSISLLTDLRSLRLTTDCLQLPSFFTRMTNLRELSFNEHALQFLSIPTGLADMPCVSGPDKARIQKRLSELAALTNLEACYLPNDHTLFPCLESLVLRSFQGKALSSSLGLYTTLKSLRIVDCPHLESLPQEITALKQLKELEDTGCANLTLPKNLRLLKALETLKIQGLRAAQSMPKLSVFRKLQNVTILTSTAP